MATAYFSTNTELGLINALTQSLTVFLPSNAIQGKSMFLKDAAGTSLFSTITIATQGSDIFEDGSIRQYLNSPYESMQLAYNPPKWYITGGTMFNTMNISSVTTNILTTNNISSSYITLSSLSLINQNSSINTFNTISSLLYYNSNRVGGGFREAVPQKINKYGFTLNPYLISNMSIWVNASSSTNFIFNGVSNIAQWNNLAVSNIPVSNTAGQQPFLSSLTFSAINYPAVYFNGINGYFQTPLASTGVSESIWAVLWYPPIGGSLPIIGYATNQPCRNFIISGNTLVINLGSSGAFITNGGTTQPSTLCIIYIVQTSLATSIYINGTLTGSAGGNYGTTISPQKIGNTGGLYFTGFMCEFIYTTQIILKDYERINIEGYLAWKYNLQSYLPSNHTYRNSPPL